LAKKEKEEEKLEKLVGKKKAKKDNIREVSYRGRYFNGIWE
jgi:hypothetical protein